MENENIENNLLENSQSPLEDPENNSFLTTDVLPSEEIVEEIEEPVEDVLENEIIDDIPQSTVTIVGSGGETYVETDNGYDDIFNSVSDNEISYEDIMDTSTEHTYVTNVYEIVEEEETPLWDSDISELGRTDTLLLLIFLLLLVQFIHNIFKGSHWFKG